MEPFVWLEAHPQEKDVWKFVSTGSGEQYVMTIGGPVMLMWLVGSLDMVEQVSTGILCVNYTVCIYASFPANMFHKSEVNNNKYVRLK